ncbi:hypothetical protein LINGRAHAP2_LOCUS5127 [Linum grandiflorum]
MDSSRREDQSQIQFRNVISKNRMFVSYCRSRVELIRDVEMWTWI